MSDPFIGEIRTFPFDYPPRGWFDCAGQLLSIQQYAALYSLIGNQWGGDGRQTFALPNLQGFTVMSQGQGSGLTNRPFKSSVGSNEVSIIATQLPNHKHNLVARFGAVTAVDLVKTPSNKAALLRPLTQPASGALMANNMFTDATSPSVNLSSSTLSQTVGVPIASVGQPHENRQPVLALRFCICWDGLYPNFDS